MKPCEIYSYVKYYDHNNMLIIISTIYFLRIVFQYLTSKLTEIWPNSYPVTQDIMYGVCVLIVLEI
jgi:hypothetical protein